MSPLEKLLSLPPIEQRAFLGLFAGARRTVQACQYGTGAEIAPKFGKAECELEHWRDFYGRKLPELGLASFAETAKLPAAGMAPGATFTRITIEPTAEGFEAREAWWARLAKVAQDER